MNSLAVSALLSHDEQRMVCSIEATDRNQLNRRFLR